MSSKYLALLVGGLIPAILLGLGAVFQKFASQPTLGTGPFLIVTGLGTCLVGGIFLLVDRDFGFDARAAGLALVFGIFWAGATGFISVSLRKLGGSLSQLVPLYNMNTLIAVIVGLILLSEWKTVNPTRILLAATFIIVGGVLAAKS